ncbi:MAG: dienelactone hydrolase family protein [Vicinamibacterales bacterium]
MTQPRDPHHQAPDDPSRRDFVALSIAAGIAAAAGTSASAQQQVTERDVEIRTPDGTCDAAFFHPTTGTFPGVLVWPDAFGLRPSMRAIGRRLAAEGYAVLVPNPFYRVQKSPVFESASNFNFGDPEQRGRLTPLMGSVTAAGAAERDATAFIAFLDAQPQVDRARKIGTQGYCMGGPLVVRTAATVPDRVGAGASFHGGGLVTDQPGSPHLLAPRIKARMYFGVARNDDEQQPTAKTTLKESFDAARVANEVEVYPALHGWCVSDMPTGNGPIYDQAQAERAWGKLLALYRTL